MDRHSKTYEQFCWVKQKNIIMEETVFHNGTRNVVCTCLRECMKSGGCKNKGLCRLWGDYGCEMDNNADDQL